MQGHTSPDLMKKQTHPNLEWSEGEDICDDNSVIIQLNNSVAKFSNYE